MKNPYCFLFAFLFFSLMLGQPVFAVYSLKTHGIFRSNMVLQRDKPITTPTRHSSTNVFAKGSEIEYNAIARKVMDKHGILTNDMYTFVKSLIDMNKPAGHGADPFFFDRKPIHSPILEIIVKELSLILPDLP